MFVKELVHLFLTIYAGILAIYYISPDEGIQSKKYAAQIYSVSVYLVDGLFAAAVLFIFWVLRFSHTRGQVDSAQQLLLLNQRIIFFWEKKAPDFQK